MKFLSTRFYKTFKYARLNIYFLRFSIFQILLLKNLKILENLQIMWFWEILTVLINEQNMLILRKQRRQLITSKCVFRNQHCLTYWASFSTYNVLFRQTMQNKILDIEKLMFRCGQSTQKLNNAHDRQFRHPLINIFLSAWI